MRKAFLSLLTFLMCLTVIFALASCGNPEIIVSDDGYVVVDGIKTDVLADKDDSVTVDENGYLVVNGVKTEHKVYTEPIISVEDGYIVVNGVKTEYEVKNKNHTFGEWKLYNEFEDDCEKKLYYRTCSDCATIEWKEGKYGDHSFATVTTSPTCQAGGYDTKTCKTCGKVEICNETTIVDHLWKSEYSGDNSFHWYDCSTCVQVKDKAEHTVGDDGTCYACNTLVGDTEGILYDLSSDGNYAVVIGYSGTSKRVKIADEYEGKPVKEIYESAFKHNNNITNVIIPDSVTSIGDYAFYMCDNLTSVTIPDSVTTIGECAFYQCGITRVTFGNGVTTIGRQAFEFCDLTSVTIPDSVISIGYCAFSNCNSALYSEYEYCKYVGDATNPYQVLLEVTNENLSNYKINAETKIIAGSSFSNCSRLSSITIPDNVIGISYSAFYNCDSLISVTIGNSVTSIGDSAFYDCESLKSVTISNSVTSIDDCAFGWCTSLTIYCDVESKPSGWAANWNYSDRPVYWAGEWEYDTEGNPTPIADTNDEMNGTYGLSHIVAELISDGTETTYLVGEYFFGMLLSTNTITPVLNNGTGTLSYTFERTVTTNITYEIVEDKFIMICEDAVDLFNDGNPQSRYELLIEEIEGETYFVLRASNGFYNFSYYVVKQDNT